MTWLWVTTAVAILVAGSNLYAFILVVPARRVTLFSFNLAIAIIIGTIGGVIYCLSHANIF